MKIKAIVFLIRRYLISAWLANVLPLVGVAIGVFFFTVVLSIMGGYVLNLKERLLALEPHLEIIVKDGFGRIPADDALIKKVTELSPEIVAVSPFQKGDAILQASSRPTTVTLVGVDPRYAKVATNYEKYIGGKDLDVLSSHMAVPEMVPETKLPPVILGKELYNFLSVDYGDRVTLVSTTRDEGPLGMAPTEFPAIVADEISLGNASVDAKWVVANIDFVNAFFGTNDEWAGLHVKLKEAMNADAVAHRINASLAADGLRAKPWTESNQALLKALQIERWGMSFVLLMVVLVGCFGITIVLVLSVRRKSREIAILRSMGMDRKSLGAVYLFQGGVIGGLGVAAGVLLGLAVLAGLTQIKLGFLPYGERPPPVLVDAGQIAFISIGSLLLSIVASLWPAIEVMSVDPVEVLADRG